VISALKTIFGARNGAAIAIPLRARFTVSTTVATVAGIALANRIGRLSMPTRPAAAISSRLASPGPSTGSGGGASGTGSQSLVSRLDAETPSTAAWCTLIINATRPRRRASVPATPSITHISHSGLLRSSGSEATCPQISDSSLRPPGGGNAMRCRCREMSKSLSSTHTG
jgi:hypothetical protein